MELQIDHVTRRFGNKTAVDDVSLTLTPGVWGLLGANGAGKTTLMRMLAGLTEPDAGTVRYNGVPLGELQERYHAVFGYLPQEFGFYAGFTVGDYLEYVAALKGVPERRTRRRIAELLEQVSLTEARGKKIARLSGGMKRRVGIAQALLNDPRVLILDEPTGGLDPGERIRFRNLLSGLGHDRIVLISTHIVSDVESIAVCHAILKAGRLLAVGTTEELVKLAEGKVWSGLLPMAALPEPGRGISVVSLRDESGGFVSIRYLAERPLAAGHVQEAPRLEDLYLWLFPQDGAEQERGAFPCEF